MNNSYVDYPVKFVKEACINHIIKINENPNKCYFSVNNITRIKHLSHICNHIIGLRSCDVPQIIHLSIEDFILLWPNPSEDWVRLQEAAESN